MIKSSKADISKVIAKSSEIIICKTKSIKRSSYELIYFHKAEKTDKLKEIRKITDLADIC